MKHVSRLALVFAFAAPLLLIGCGADDVICANNAECAEMFTCNDGQEAFCAIRNDETFGICECRTISDG